jgi:signal transduction histidine kinase
LYIVAQIVQAHGGSVDVQSGQDDVTSFRVRIPRTGSK